MSTKEPLLVVRHGTEGSFIDWLKELGLENFLREFPFTKLVEWGWLVPQYRLIFPHEIFEEEERKDPIIISFIPEPVTDPQQQLLYPSWYVSSVEKPLWFLCPYFQSDDLAACLLRDTGSPISRNATPPKITLSDGRVLRPYAEYFFHWQGYALIDHIRSSGQMLITPNFEERIRRNPQIAIYESGFIPPRWNRQLVDLMTWLSHYRALREATYMLEQSHAEYTATLQNGARKLADHLGITPEALECAIKEHLLVLAQDWYRDSRTVNYWANQAWFCLQSDTYLAVAWLCNLNGKTFDYYLEEWQYSSLGQPQWAELKKALPFEFFMNRLEFLKNAGHYLKFYNPYLPDAEQLVGENLKRIVDQLRAKNYPFGSLLAAFRQMHDLLTHDSDDFSRVEFRERRPIDFYSLVGIRAEGCLRFALDQSNELKHIKEKDQGLFGYIIYLAEKRGLSVVARKYICSKAAKELVKLHGEPDNPIGKIVSLNLNFSTKELCLVKAFLCCLLARNYFAHHYYRDDKLLTDKDSAFMLGGVLVTVLFLLDC